MKTQAVLYLNLELMRAAEKAINILIQAQRDCEEKCISESENSAAE